MTTLKTRLIPAFSLILSTALPAQWREVTPNYSLFYQQLSVVSADTAFAVAVDIESKPVLIATQDGGRHWKKLPLPFLDSLESPSVMDLDFKDGKNGFLLIQYYRPNTLLGIKSLLLRTSDGGQHWYDDMPPAAEPKDWTFREICFADPQHGVLLSETAGSSMRIRTTSDGGNTWEVAVDQIAFLSGLQLRPDGTGWAMESSDFFEYWKTNDFGHSWFPVPFSELTSHWSLYRQGGWYQNEFFYSETDAYRLSQVYVGNSFVTQYMLESTSDGGFTWNPEPVRVFNSYLEGLTVKDNTTWLRCYDQLYRRSDDPPADPPRPAGVLDIRPNPAVPGAWVRLLEPRETTVYAEIRLLELATGREVFRDTPFMGGGRTLFKVPDVLPGFYVVQFFFGGDLRATGKLVVR